MQTHPCLYVNLGAKSISLRLFALVCLLTESAKWVGGWRRGLPLGSVFWLICGNVFWLGCLI